MIMVILKTANIFTRNNYRGMGIWLGFFLWRKKETNLQYSSSHIHYDAILHILKLQHIQIPVQLNVHEY